MTIDNPIATKYGNEVIRPLSEKIRALNAELESAITQWFGGTNALFPNDSTPFEDGRADEGVSRLVGSDVNSSLNIFIALTTAINTEIIEKPCVRVLQAN